MILLFFIIVATTTNALLECSSMMNCTSCLLASNSSRCLWCVEQMPNNDFIETCRFANCTSNEFRFTKSCPVYTYTAVPAWKILLEPANFFIFFTLTIAIVLGSVASKHAPVDHETVQMQKGKIACELRPSSAYIWFGRF